MGTYSPCSGRVESGIRADPKFFGGIGVGRKWRTDSATNLRRKAFDSCKLFVYIWLLGLRPQTPTRAPPWTPLGDFRPTVLNLTLEPCYASEVTTFEHAGKENGDLQSSSRRWMSVCVMFFYLREHAPEHL